MRDGVRLMFVQLYQGIHAWKFQVAAVILSRPRLIENIVILVNQRFPPLRVAEYPVPERVFYQIFDLSKFSYI
jgi:hypothetical protein